MLMIYPIIVAEHENNIPVRALELRANLPTGVGSNALCRRPMHSEGMISIYVPPERHANTRMKSSPNCVQGSTGTLMVQKLARERA